MLRTQKILIEVSDQLAQYVRYWSHKKEPYRYHSLRTLCTVKNEILDIILYSTQGT